MYMYIYFRYKRHTHTLLADESFTMTTPACLNSISLAVGVKKMFAPSTMRELEGVPVASQNCFQLSLLIVFGRPKGTGRYG